MTWTAGDRVQWRCSAHACTLDIHVGVITTLSIEQARETGLRVVQRQMRSEPAVGVLFDGDPLTTITFVPLRYVETEGSPIRERIF